MIQILKKCRSKVWSLVSCILYPRSLVSGEGANKLSRVESLNVRSWLLLFEDLPDLVADVVVQQLRPHHRHEHRPHHDRHPHLVIEMIAIRDIQPFKAALSCSHNLDVLEPPFTFRTMPKHF